MPPLGHFGRVFRPTLGRKDLVVNTKPSFDSIINLWQTLSEEEQREVSENPQGVKRRAAAMVRCRRRATFVEHLDDKGLSEVLQPITAKYRNLAAELGYTGPVAWRVKAGFTVKQHAPLAGPCYERFEYWSFRDEPTKAAIVFWVPRIIPDSTAKTVDEQRTLLSEVRTRLELPEHHLSGFGSVALVIALILAHFKRTGERVPLQQLSVRTDTRHSDGNRLDLGFFVETGLRCDRWCFDVDGSGDLGVFALGVELEQ